jgi:hypothetical protein
VLLYRRVDPVEVRERLRLLRRNREHEPIRFFGLLNVRQFLFEDASEGRPIAKRSR